MLAEIGARGAVACHGIGIMGADGERIDRAQRDADFDAAGAGTRDIGIGERAQIEIDLVVRIAVEIRRGAADAAVEQCLYDTGIVPLRPPGLNARRALGPGELDEPPRPAPLRLARPDPPPGCTRERAI